MTKDNFPPGFLPDASGGPGARFGRDPVTGRAYKADGTVRKARTTLDASERLAAVEASKARIFANIGASMAESVPALAGVVGMAEAVKRWARECRAYGTPEARATRRAYFLRMAEAVEAKGRAAEAYLEAAGPALATVEAVYAALGAVAASGGSPADAVEAVEAALPPKARTLLVRAGAPDADPFAGFRRADAEPDA
jgi:hypothetical protein